MPTCCACHIDGYKEKFPPINSYNNHDDYRFSASNIHSQHTPYSTILNEDDDEDDEDDSIAYQYSNGFKRSPSKLNKYGDSILSSSSITKPRYDKNKLSKQPFLSNPLDSYLTPPTSNDFDGVGSFKRGTNGFTSAGGLSSRKRRRPVRTNNRDQNLSGSEFLPDITLIPNYDQITERSSSFSIKRKSTTPHIASSGAISTKRVSIGGPLPSISTASTSSIDLGKRVNYNYHPIIDFFGDSMKSDKEIDDRVGYSEPHTWRPVQAIRRRQRR